MKKYSYALYRKEGNKEIVNIINYNTYEEAKKNLESEISSKNLNLEDAQKIEEGGDTLILIFDNLILKICSFVI